MNRFKKYIEELGLSFPKEIALIISSNVFTILCSIALYIFLKSNIILFLSAFLLIIVNIIFLYRYVVIKTQIINKHNSEFVDIFSYFKIYIENGNNVYNSIKFLIPFCSSWMKDKIEILLIDIDHDKSIKPFIVFSKNFFNVRIESVLTSVYQMVDQGETNKNNNEFTFIFNELYEQERNELLLRKQKSLDLLSSFPLIGSALITLLLTIGIVFIIGEMINVI